MKKIVLLILPLAAIMCLAIFANAAPRLTIPETTFNFGFCPQEADVSHKFKLVSTGDEPLQIMQVIPGCSCTKAPLDKDRLNVGDSTIVEIIFSTKKYLNRVTKTPAIQTNEGPPDKKLQIVATIVSNPDSTYPLVIQPFKLNLSQKTDKVIDRIEFGIRNVSDQELKLDFVSGAPEFFTVELPKSVKPGELAKGKLVLTKVGVDKKFSKSFTFECSDNDATRFTLPVKRTFKDE